jgi:DNA-binding transcriptional regulator GbsR (MarR family)
MDKNTTEFIERMGLIWEQEGFPRIAGRIFGMALISPNACSLDEFAEALGVSKASVSNDARMLTSLGMIERVGRPGDRRDYYQITRDSIARSLAEKVDRVRMIEEAVTDALRLKIGHADVRDRLVAHQMTYRAVIKALETTIADLAAQGVSPKRRSRRA